MGGGAGGLVGKVSAFIQCRAKRSFAFFFSLYTTGIIIT